jgi:hypothetical protein
MAGYRRGASFRHVQSMRQPAAAVAAPGGAFVQLMICAA